MDEACDAIVIGGGPAGLAAATWLGRYRRSTIVFDSREWRNRWTEESHGYLGSDPMDPNDFRTKARDGLERYPLVRLVETEVRSVSTDEEGCFVADAGGSGRATGRRLVLATGVTDAFPIQLVQVAAATGTVAGIGAALSLRGEPGADGAPDPAPDPEVETASPPGS